MKRKICLLAVGWGCEGCGAKVEIYVDKLAGKLDGDQ